jgi:hypothetical protein
LLISFDKLIWLQPVRGSVVIVRQSMLNKAIETSSSMGEKMNAEQKALKQQYLETPRPMGVFQIRNLANEKIFVSKSLDLPGSFNRHRVQLQSGSHASRALQSDWQSYGATQFAFEVLDELTPRAVSPEEIKADLDSLEKLWLEQLQPYGERGYNEPPKSREERLQMIMSNRSSQDDTSM